MNRIIGIIVAAMGGAIMVNQPLWGVIVVIGAALFAQGYFLEEEKAQKNNPPRQR